MLDSTRFYYVIRMSGDSAKRGESVCAIEQAKYCEAIILNCKSRVEATIAFREQLTNNECA